VNLIFSEFLLIYFWYAASSFFVTRFVDPHFNAFKFLLDDNGWFRLLIVVASVVAAIYFQNLYTKIHVASGVLLFQQVATGIGAAIAVQGLMMYLVKDQWFIGRWVMLFGSLLTLLLTPPWRMFYSAVILRTVGTQRTLFVGNSYAVREITNHLMEQPEVGLLNLGFVDAEASNGDSPGGQALGKLPELACLADELKPDLIVVGLPDRRM
jgi:FlaA1/EpsC-like NDP-sugar epimerase